MLSAPRIFINKAFISAAALGLASASTHAASLYWDGTNTTVNADGGTGTWDTSATNWDSAGTDGTDATWSNATPDSAVFGGTAGTVTLGTGITAGGITFTTTGYTVTGNTLTLGNATVGVDTGSGVSATIGSILAGTNTGLVKTGAGTLTLSGANTFTGNLAVNAGTVAVTSSGNLGAGTVSINTGGTLNFAHASGMQTISRALSGTGNFVKDGAGVLVIDGANTFSGTYTLQSGDTVFNSVTAENGAPSVVINGGRLLLGSPFANGTATIGNLSGTGGSISTAYGAAVGTRTLSVNQTVDATFAGAMQDASGGRVLAFTKTGAATLTLAGAGAFTGPANILQGALKIGNSTALGATNYSVTKVVIGSGATLDLNGFGDTKYGVTLAGGALVNTGAATARNLIQTPNLLLSANATVGGSGDFAMIASGYGANSLDLAGFTLTKTGTNSLGMASTTATAGTIRVEGGAIEMGISNGGTGFTGTSTAINLAATGSKLTVTRASTIGSLSGAVGTLLALNNTLTIGTLSPTNFFGGDITGTGQLALGGSGRFTFDRTTDGSVAVTISGTGSLGKSGTGKLTLTGANTFSGGTFITEGTLVVGSTAAFGSGAVIVNGGTLNMGGRALSNSVTLSGGSLAGDGTLNGVLTAANLSTSSNLTLAGANNLTGTTLVSAGILTVANVGALGTSSVAINGGTLDLNGKAVNNSITVAGGTLQGGIGYTGTISATSGTFHAGTNSAKIYSISSSGATFTDLDGQATFNGGLVTVTGTHAVGNSPGAQTFNSGLTYADGATVAMEFDGRIASSEIGGVNWDTITVIGGLTIGTGVNFTWLAYGAENPVDYTETAWDTSFSKTLLTADAILGDFDLPVDEVIEGEGVWHLSQDDKSVTATWTAVPEPSTYGLLGSAALAAASLVRRRRKVQ